MQTHVANLLAGEASSKDALQNTTSMPQVWLTLILLLSWPCLQYNLTSLYSQVVPGILQSGT